jgi:hypothetical protein
MIRSYKTISKLNNSIQGGITCNNLNIQNQLISSQIIYQSYTGPTGPTGFNGPINYGIQTGPTGFNETGPTGIIGPLIIIYGDQGQTGPTGPIGKNIIGPIGPTGENGINYIGPTGITGYSGDTNNKQGPTGPSLTYTKISNTFDGVNNTSNQPITTITLSNYYYVQWYVKLTATSSSDVITIYFGVDQDSQMIPLSGTTSISGSGIYNSDITFQYYYNSTSSNTFSIYYQIGYIQLFN